MYNMVEIILKLLEDIPDVEICSSGESAILMNTTSKPLCVCLEEYFFRIANEDDVYDRFMCTMRQIRKPLFYITGNKDYIEALLSAIKNGAPMSTWDSFVCKYYSGWFPFEGPYLCFAQTELHVVNSYPSVILDIYL